MPLESASREMQALAAEVVGYFESNPDAEDTLEGVAGWWVERRGGSLDAALLARVLDDLTTRGVLEEVGIRRPRRYRLRRR